VGLEYLQRRRHHNLPGKMVLEELLKNKPRKLMFLLQECLSSPRSGITPVLRGVIGN